jgi:competence protein ComEC
VYLTERAPLIIGLATVGAAALGVVLLRLPQAAVCARDHEAGAGADAGSATYPAGGAAGRAGWFSAALAIGLLAGACVRLGIWVGEEQHHLPVPPGAVRVAEGTVRGQPRLGKSGWTAGVRLDHLETTSGRYEARLELPAYGLQQRPVSGRRLRINGRLAAGEHGLYLVSDEVEKLGWAGVSARLASATTGRLVRRVDRAMSELGPAAWLSRALLLGRSDGAPAYAEDVFRQSGTAHILALSGMHLGILIALSVIVLAPLLGHRRALYVSLGLIGLYLAMVGFRASLARASLMFALATASLVLGRRPEPLRILAVSFIAVAVLAPSSVDGLSFQLSFAALAGILVVGRGLDRHLQPLLPAVLRRPLAASVGAQLATMPLLFAAFGVVRPVGAIATLVMAPIAVLFIWVSVAATAAVLAAGGLIVGVASAVLAALESALLSAGELFSRAPGVYAGDGWAPVAGAFAVAVSAAILRLGSASGRKRLGGPPSPPAATGDPDDVWGPL